MNKTPIIRRQLVDEIVKGSFSAIALMHMAHYDTSAKCMVDESRRLGRPIDVVNIGAGDLWDLRVLISGMKISKASILRTYTAVDIVSRSSPFGKSLSQYITFNSIAQDLMQNSKLDMDAISADLIISTEFIEHIDRQSAVVVLEEMHRILRPGGLVYITTPNADNSTRSDKYHTYEWPLPELLITLENIGFEIYNCQGTYIDQRKFDRCNAIEHRISEELVEIIKTRFSSNFYRLILATPYPEYSNGVALFAGKSNGKPNQK